jgi:alcohol dehydrogenase (cytochrome c)
MKLPSIKQIIIGAVFILVISMGAVTFLVPELSWRASVVGIKLTGDLPDLEWSDLLRMIKPGSGYYLKPIIKTRNPYSVIENPYTSVSDTMEGKNIFERLCSKCHGSDGTGVSGPSLIDNKTIHGGSHWSLYQIITKGVAGTAMQSQGLSEKEVWQVISYIRALENEPGSEHGINVKENTGIDTIAKSPVDFTRLKNALDEPENWMSYSGSYNGHRHSPLRQINKENITKLRLEWAYQMETEHMPVETTPVIVDGIMYATEPPNKILALDAGTGQLLWSYNHQLPKKLSLCCGSINRGVAILDDKVFIGTLDANLVALDKVTGKKLWDVSVGNPGAGYSITSAPLAIDGKIIVGVAGGEYGIRGFLDAYDPISGKRMWRSYTIPATGEPGNKTWSGRSWETGGGPTWMIGSYDPELNLIYWGTGNPSPDFLGDVREGDNLYTCSVIAVDADTGKLKWHYQFTPHDTHDWDANQVPVLIDSEVNGMKRKLLVTANKNGFYYVLDRETGEFLHASEFAKQTWANGIDRDGRPQVRENSEPSEKGTLIYPSASGATNWWPPAYSKDSGLFYVPVAERGAIYFKHYEEHETGNMYLGSAGQGIVGGDSYTAVRALVATTGKLKWEFRLPPRKKRAKIGGILSTSTGLIFFGDNNHFYALDSVSGEKLWDVNLGGWVHAAPATYMVNNIQMVTIAAGKTLFTFSVSH